MKNVRMWKEYEGQPKTLRFYPEIDFKCPMASAKSFPKQRNLRR